MNILITWTIKQMHPQIISYVKNKWKEKVNKHSGITESKIDESAAENEFDIDGAISTLQLGMIQQGIEGVWFSISLYLYICGIKENYIFLDARVLSCVKGKDSYEVIQYQEFLHGLKQLIKSPSRMEHKSSLLNHVLTNSWEKIPQFIN